VTTLFAGTADATEVARLAGAVARRRRQEAVLDRPVDDLERLRGTPAGDQVQRDVDRQVAGGGRAVPEAAPVL
jgi:hypothetical protein